MDLLLSRLENIEAKLSYRGSQKKRKFTNKKMRKSWPLSMISENASWNLLVEKILNEKIDTKTGGFNIAHISKNYVLRVNKASFAESNTFSEQFIEEYNLFQRADKLNIGIPIKSGAFVNSTCQTTKDTPFNDSFLFYSSKDNGSYILYDEIKKGGFFRSLFTKPKIIELKAIEHIFFEIDKNEYTYDIQLAQSVDSIHVKDEDIIPITVMGGTFSRKQEGVEGDEDSLLKDQYGNFYLNTYKEFHLPRNEEYVVFDDSHIFCHKGKCFSNKAKFHLHSEDDKMQNLINQRRQRYGAIIMMRGDPFTFDHIHMLDYFMKRLNHNKCILLDNKIQNIVVFKNEVRMIDIDPRFTIFESDEKYLANGQVTEDIRNAINFSYILVQIKEHRFSEHCMRIMDSVSIGLSELENIILNLIKSAEPRDDPYYDLLQVHLCEFFGMRMYHYASNKIKDMRLVTGSLQELLIGTLHNIQLIKLFIESK